MTPEEPTPEPEPEEPTPEPEPDEPAPEPDEPTVDSPNTHYYGLLPGVVKPGETIDLPFEALQDGETITWSVSDDALVIDENGRLTNTGRGTAQSTEGSVPVAHIEGIYSQSNIIIDMYVAYTLSESTASSQCGDGVTYTISGHTLEISGSGAMWDFTQPPWLSYASDITSVVIGSGITSVGAGTFSCLTNVSTVYIPDGVTAVGSAGRYLNEYAPTATYSLPASVTSIGMVYIRGLDDLWTGIAGDEGSYEGPTIIFRGTEAQWNRVSKDPSLSYCDVIFQ